MEHASTTYIVLKELAGNPPPRLNAIQQLIAPHVDTITAFWIALWIATSCVLLGILWHEYKKQRNSRS